MQCALHVDLFLLVTIYDLRVASSFLDVYLFSLTTVLFYRGLLGFTISSDKDLWCLIIDSTWLSSFTASLICWGGSDCRIPGPAIYMCRFSLKNEVYYNSCDSYSMRCKWLGRVFCNLVNYTCLDLSFRQTSVGCGVLHHLFVHGSRSNHSSFVEYL